MEVIYPIYIECSKICFIILYLASFTYTVDAIPAVMTLDIGGGLQGPDERLLLPLPDHPRGLQLCRHRTGLISKLSRGTGSRFYSRKKQPGFGFENLNLTFFLKIKSLLIKANMIVVLVL